MFFFLPTGHDQDVYSWPWRTFVIIAICAGVLWWQRQAEPRAEWALRDRVHAVDRYLDANDEAAVSPEVLASLPRAVAVAYRDLAADEDYAADPELDLLVLDVGQALRRMPSRRFGYVPAEHRPVSFITSMFMHGDVSHLVGNMLILYLLGPVVECFWSGFAFLGLFLLSGIGGVVGHQLFHAGSQVPLVGASGALAGVMAAFLLGHARTRIRIRYFVFLFYFVKLDKVDIPALWLISAWALLQAWNTFDGTRDGVSYPAHVGGFVVGVGLTLLARKRHWIAQDAGHIWA